MLSLLGLWRLWLGGGFGRSPVLLQYAALFALCFGAGFVHHAPWYLSLIDALGILFLARAYGHGPMLSLPIGQRTDGAPDEIYKLIAGIKDDELRWWAYSLIRYPCFACPWALGRMIAGVDMFELPIIGALFIVILYRVLWTFREALPHFAIPGDQVENWTELLGWTFLGALVSFG